MAIGLQLSRSVFEPDTKADMFFSVDAACQCYGQVLALSSPDPSKCYIITGSTVVAEKESTAVIRVVNYQGEPCEMTTKCDCELKSLVKTDTRASHVNTYYSLYLVARQDTLPV